MINTKFKPFIKMIERLESSKDESDTAYFNDLLLLGEMLTKTVVSSLVGGITDDKDRNRYRQLHKLVRADGIGEWSTVLEEVLNGVASQFLHQSIREREKVELTQKVEQGNWQYDSVEQLFNVINIIDLPQYKEMPRKAQAKNWFSIFASLRNGTRGHGAVLPAIYSEACVPLEDSIKLVIENFFLFKREWVYLSQNMSGKYRVTNLNASSNNFDILKSDRSFVSKYHNGVYVWFDEGTNVELINSNPDASDFFYPNGNFREKQFEFLSYISNKRQEGNSTKYLIPAEDLPPSETQGLGSLDVIGNCFCNLPPIYNNYVNRKDLEEELNNVLLEDDRYPIVTLKGGGGIGKTSLALSVLIGITKVKRFDVILWFSSRDIDLKTEGAKSVKNSILDENDIANEFVELMLNKTIKSSQEKIKYLSQQLSKSDIGSILFVFDNFETVRNQAELFKWLDTYVRNPNKILITSRTSKTFKADYPIEIMGMKDSECRVLIEETSESYGINYLMTDKVIDNIIQNSSGHPYIIKMLLGEFSKDKNIKDITKVVASKDDILVALFRRTYDWLSPSAKRVFLTLCSWRSVVPQIALEAVLLSTESERIDVEEAVEELRKSSFIEVITNQNDEVFLNVPLAASLFGKSELEVSPDKVAILLDRDLLQEFGAAQQSDIANGVKPRILRKFREIANRISKGKADLETHRPTFEYIARKYPIGWLYLSQMYEENSDLVRAQGYLQEFLKTDSSDNEKKEVWQKLADLYENNEEWFNRINALMEKCSLPDTSLYEISELANETNKYFQQNKLQLDTDIKEKIVQKIADLMDKRMEFATSIDYSRLAWLYLHLKNERQAINMTRSGLEKNPEDKYCRNLAQTLKINLVDGYSLT